MKLISTRECKPGMKLGRPIYSASGQTLLNHKMELTASMIQRLNAMGYDYIYVDDPSMEGIYIEDSIQLETRIALRLSLEQLIDRVTNTPTVLMEGRLSVSELCWDAIHMVVKDLQSPRQDIIMITNVNAPKTEKVVGHFIQNAINVCVYATQIGIQQGIQGKDLMALSMGALLHDIGSLRLSQEILQKPRALTSSEYQHIKQHAELGFQMLKNEPGIPITSALCALMHHERIDGSGYPNGLKGDEIHPFARWIGLVDAYDAMTNPRPYRKAMLPHVAMEILYAGAGTLYDYDKVDFFRKKLAIFPVGLHVTLSTGEQGVVSRVNPDSVHRPVIRILKDALQRELSQPYEIDLAQQLHIMIEQIDDNIAV